VRVCYCFTAKIIINKNDVYKKVNSLCRKLIIPFGGTGFAFVHLTTPAHYFGFKTPLKCLWATGMARMASLSTNLLNQDGKLIASIDNKEFLNDKDWASLHIEDHRDACAKEYLDFYRSQPSCGPLRGMICTSDLKSSKDPAARRRSIYEETVVQGWKKERWSLGPGRDQHGHPPG